MFRTDHRLVRRSLVTGVLLLATVAAGCVRQPVDTPPKSVVFFNSFSADLDGPANGVIREFARDALTAPNRPITVLGYADAAGSPEANRMLSALRAKVVTDALVGQGIAANRITQRPRGATDTDPGIESRRVEIELGR